MSTTETPSERRDPSLGARYLAHLLRRWWLPAAQGVGAMFVFVIVVAATGTTTYHFTGHFVLHPDPKSDTSDVANKVSVLEQNGPLVETVLKVLGSGQILQDAADDAHVHGTSGYRNAATVSPGSSYFDAVVSGRNRQTTDLLGRHVEKVASAYVASSYPGFRLDVLGSDQSSHDAFPPGPSALLLVLLLGAVAGAAELLVPFALEQLRADGVLRPARVAALEEEPRREVEPAPGTSAPRSDGPESLVVAIEVPDNCGPRERATETNGAQEKAASDAAVTRTGASEAGARHKGSQELRAQEEPAEPPAPVPADPAHVGGSNGEVPAEDRPLRAANVSKPRRPAELRVKSDGTTPVQDAKRSISPSPTRPAKPASVAAPSSGATEIGLRMPRRAGTDATQVGDPPPPRKPRRAGTDATQVGDPPPPRKPRRAGTDATQVGDPPPPRKRRRWAPET